jgi:ADP-ribose pyrophosphatase YjhB (NUDIX family)
MRHKIIVKVGVLVEQRGKLLLIREKGWKDHRYHWNIVKGTFEPEQDKDLLDAAQREAKEEANASISVESLLNIIYLQKDNQTLIQFNFVAKLIGSHFSLSEPQQQKKYRTSEEIVDIKLFRKQDLKKMKKSEFIGERTYVSIRAWLKRRRSGLDIIEIARDY